MVGTRQDQTPQPSAGKQSPMPFRENLHRHCQHLPSALLAFSGCESKRGCAEGNGAGSVFLHQLLCEPASEAETEFPAWADMLSPLSNCSLAQGSRVLERDLAPSPPLHCLFPQPGSRRVHSFSSPASRPAVPRWLCLTPHISALSSLLSPSSSFKFSIFYPLP